MDASRINGGPPPSQDFQSPTETTDGGSSSSGDACGRNDISPALQGLLRSRSPVRSDPHADRRWTELPRSIRSQNEALEHLEGLETAHNLPMGHELYIDFESYRRLANSLHAQTHDLPMEAPQGTAEAINEHPEQRSAARHSRTLAAHVSEIPLMLPIQRAAELDATLETLSQRTQNERSVTINERSAAFVNLARNIRQMPATERSMAFDAHIAALNDRRE